MGRKSKTRALSVWMNGELVGQWRLPARGGQEFAYADSWLESRAARPLSLSMPLRPAAEPYRNEVPVYFENLLPDNAEIRSRMQRRFGAATAEAFDLLVEAGRDCVGAIQLVPTDEPAPDVQKIEGRRLDAAGVEAVLAGNLSTAWGDDNPDTFRISLAGAQEKTALLWQDNAWHVPHGATPTTHLFKLPIGKPPQGIDLSTSVENEWLCSELVAAYGIPVAPCRMESFGQYKTLIVERFDRKLAEDGRWWRRLPQEDFCQATATPPALKYENDGGPGIRTIMELLLGSNNAEADRRDFMRTQVVFWLLAAIDGHAKNFSLSLLAGSGFQLTPRYDILSAHPFMGHGHGKLAVQKMKMAMAVEGKSRHYHWPGIRLRHWLESAKRCGFAGIEGVIDELIAMTPEVIGRVRAKVPANFPESIANGIFEGTQNAARELGAELAQMKASH